MKIYKAVTALVLFAAFAYAQDEAVDEEDDDDDADESDDEEVELIDISELWDELQQDEDFQAWKAQAEAADEQLFTEWWGYVEAYVALYDASVDAQELSYNDIDDLVDYMEELEEEDFEAL